MPKNIPVSIYFHTTLILFPSNKSFEDENPSYIAKHPALEKNTDILGFEKKPWKSCKAHVWSKSWVLAMNHFHG